MFLAERFWLQVFQNLSSTRLDDEHSANRINAPINTPSGLIAGPAETAAVSLVLPAAGVTDGLGSHSYRM
jgi:hypothetical protein